MLHITNITSVFFPFFQAIIILQGPKLIVYHVLYILHQLKDKNKNSVIKAISVLFKYFFFFFFFF